jgi:hypothetical protein
MELLKSLNVSTDFLAITYLAGEKVSFIVHICLGDPSLKGTLFKEN